MKSNKFGYMSGKWWFIPAALAAGVINGLLGAGGGVVMMYLVRAVLKQRGDGEDVQKDAFATVVAIMLAVSLVSAITYGANGNLSMEKMQNLTFPAIVGGVIGAYLTERLPARTLRGIFALLVIVSGIRMVM